MNFLLDTCILSKLRKIKSSPTPTLESWVSSYPESSYFINVLTIGEIQKGISKLALHDMKTKTVLQEWLNRELIPRFEKRTLLIDTQTVLIWGDICGNAQKKGLLIPVIDSLLAASAIQHHLILVTVNSKDFIHTGVRLFNPLEQYNTKHDR